MRKLSDWHNFHASCDTSTGHPIFFGFFGGTVGADHVVLQIVITPYHGAGTYTQHGADGALDLVEPLDIAVATIPESARWGAFPPQGGTIYSTRHTPRYPVLSPVPNGPPGPGQATVAINADGKSGRIDAVLDFGTATDRQTLKVVGSFNCGRVGQTTVG